MNSRLDSLLSTVLRHADNAPTFAQRIAWTMLARGIAAQADAADSRRYAVDRFVAGVIAPAVTMAYAFRTEHSAPSPMAN
jgi:hypothetical protein